MSRPDFYPLDRFRGAESSIYHLLPFRFMALDADRELIVNEVGEHLIAPTGTARRLIRREVSSTEPLYRRLKAKQFLYDTSSSPLLDIMATKYRTRKAFLEGFTQLHLFVVSLRCEHSCPYCQVSRRSSDHMAYDMSVETAERSLELMFRSPAPCLTMEFQGGEPLLNFPLIRHLVQAARRRAEVEERRLRVVVASNLALLTDEMLDFFGAHDVYLSTSLDGPEDLHNANRPRPGGNSYELVIQGMERARAALGPGRVAALMTTTRRSLGRAREIVDEYVRRGFGSIFLRRMSPYGFAVKTRHALGYSLDEFLEFYFEGLDYILDLNRQGQTMEEAYARILLTRVLTPFTTGYVDLQSPAGAGVSVVVYNYDGDVYASDESRMLAEMGDRTFLLGNVHQDAYEAIFGGARLRSIVRKGCAEGLPGCSDCALLPYCGADPVFHHATQGDLVGHRPTSDFCAQNMAILKQLFRLLDPGDPVTNEIFFSWLREIPRHELREALPA